VTYQTHIEHLASMKADCVVAGVWAKSSSWKHYKDKS